MGSATAQRLISLAATLSLVLIYSTPANSINDTPSAYNVLHDKYNFPVGLLPKGVIGYDLDPTTGQFSAYFNQSCSFSFQTVFRLTYNTTIKGYISDGKVSNLEGVTVKLFLVSVNIVEVVRSSESVIVSVGFASTGFPIDTFEESPRCGCGFDCTVVKVKDA